MPHREIIGFLVKNLEILGANPYKKRIIIKNLIILFPAVLTWFLGLYQFFNEELTFDNVASGVETILTTTHFIFKYVALMIYHDKSQILLEETGRFSSISHEFDDDFQQSYRNSIRIIKIIRNYFISVGCTASIIVLFIPILLNDLVLACYTPKWINRTVFIYFNCFTFCLTTCVAISYDLFAFTILSLTRLQFKIHNKRVELLNIESSDNKAVLLKMEDWIKHHLFLYNYVSLYNSIFKIPILLEYLIFISSMCFELYFISTPGINIVNIFKSLIYICGLASQLVIYYCWPAELLSEESSKTAFYLYDTPWYDCESMSIKKNLLLMMMRSQKAAVVWAGNLFIVNLRTTTQAFKASMSYFTTLKTMGME